MIESSPIITPKKAAFFVVFKRLLFRFPLAVVLLLQALTSLFTLRNTAFQDEALYLFAGREILLSYMGKVGYLEPYGLYFSGYPFFYPVIGGALDFLGGLEAARLFSLLCMLIVTTCVYLITLQIFERKLAALLAAFLFAGEGSVLFLGRLATYDAFCLCLLALALLLCLHAGKAVSAQSVLAFGPLLVLLVAAKYAGLLFVPTVLAFLALWTWQRKGLEEMLVRGGIALFSLAASGIVGFLAMDKQVLTGLSFTTVNRVSFIQTPPAQVLQHIAMMEGIFFVLAFLGLLLSGKKYLLFGLLFFASALLVPLYHAYKGELVSLDKHLAFTMLFLAPLAGFSIAFIISGWQKLFPSPTWLKHFPWLTALVFCLFTIPFGLLQSYNLYTDWPSSTQLTTLWHPQIQRAIGHYLAEDYDVSRYNLKNETDLWEWTSLDYFVYTDKKKHDFSGEAAYKAAIQDGYFDLVELSYGYHTYLSKQLEQSLIASNQYDLVGKVPFHNSYTNGYYWLWKKHSH